MDQAAQLAAPFSEAPMKRENLKITLTVKGHEPVHTTSDDLARMVKVLKALRKARDAAKAGEAKK